MKYCLLIFCFFLCSLILPTTAQAMDWEVDPAHSGIYFSIDHVYSKVRGVFPEYTATIRFHPANLAQSMLSFDVATQQIHTGIPKRDSHLRKKEFFDVAAFPAMRFVSSSITHRGSNAYTVTGMLTIKDVSKRLTLPFTWHAPKVNPLNPDKMLAGLETEFTLNRLDYGVGTGKLHKMGVLGNEVRILISLEVLRNR